MSRIVAVVFALMMAMPAWAVDIEVRQDEWLRLSPEEQASMQKLLDEAFPNQDLTIVALPGAAPASFGSDLAKFFCKALCDIGSTTIVVGCPTVGGTAGAVLSPLCAKIAEEGKKFCYAKCDQIE